MTETMKHALRFVGYPICFLLGVLAIGFLEELATPLKMIILAHAWSRWTLAAFNMAGLAWCLWRLTE